MRPPVCAAGLGQVDVDGFGAVGVVGGDYPGRVVDEDWVGEVALFWWLVLCYVEVWWREGGSEGWMEYYWESMG